jgi:hypothetical protein
MMQGVVVETGCDGQMDVSVRLRLGFEALFRVTGVTALIEGLLDAVVYSTMLLMSAWVPPVNAMYKTVVELVTENKPEPGITLIAELPAQPLEDFIGPAPAIRFLGPAKPCTAIPSSKRRAVADLRIVFRGVSPRGWW